MDKKDESLKLTVAEMEAHRTEKGGFSRATLAKWGVPWPPPAGWRKALIAGKPIPGTKKPENVDRSSGLATVADPAAVLQKLVMTVINAGQGHLLCEIPELNKFPLPTVGQIIGPRTIYGIEGQITLQDAVYRFTCMRESP